MREVIGSGEPFVIIQVQILKEKSSYNVFTLVYRILNNSNRKGSDL